jgi:hypothetical protein
MARNHALGFIRQTPTRASFPHWFASVTLDQYRQRVSGLLDAVMPVGVLARLVDAYAMPRLPVGTELADLPVNEYRQRLDASLVEHSPLLPVLCSLVSGFLCHGLDTATRACVPTLADGFLAPPPSTRPYPEHDYRYGDEPEPSYNKTILAVRAHPTQPGSWRFKQDTLVPANIA